MSLRKNNGKHEKRTIPPDSLLRLAPKQAVQPEARVGGTGNLLDGFWLDKFFGRPYELNPSDLAPSDGPIPLPAVQYFSPLQRQFAASTASMSATLEVEQDPGSGLLVPEPSSGNMLPWATEEAHLLPHPAHYRETGQRPLLLRHPLAAHWGEFRSPHGIAQSPRSAQDETPRLSQRSTGSQSDTAAWSIPLRREAGFAGNGYFSGEAEPMNFSSDDSDMPQFPMPGPFGDSSPPNRLIPDVERDLMRSGGGYRPSRGILNTPPPLDPAREIKPIVTDVNPLSSQTFRASSSRIQSQRETNLKEVVSRHGVDQIGPETLLEIRDLYRTGDRDRAFKLLEAFVRAYPHHEPATKLYRALTLQRKLSSESDSQAAAAAPNPFHARETLPPKPSPVSVTPIVALGPAETTASDTPIPVLLGSDNIGMQLNFQADEPSPMDRSTAARTDVAIQPSSLTDPSQVAAHLPLPHETANAEQSAADTKRNAQDRMERLPNPDPSIQQVDTGILKSHGSESQAPNDPLLPDFTLEPALDFRASSAPRHDGISIEEPSEVPPEAFSGATHGRHSKYSQENIDWSWNGRKEPSSSAMGSNGAPPNSSNEQSTASGEELALPESWASEPLTFAAEPFSTDVQEQVPLDWGYSQEPPNQSRPATTDISFQVEEQITTEVALKETAGLQSDDRTEQPVTDSEGADKDRQTASLETARDMLFGFFTPAPSPTLGSNPSDYSWASSQQPDTQHVPDLNEDPSALSMERLALNRGEQLTSFASGDEIFTSDSSAKELSLFGSAVPLELDSSQPFASADSSIAPTQSAAQPLLQEVLLSGVSFSEGDTEIKDSSTGAMGVRPEQTAKLFSDETALHDPGTEQAHSSPVEPLHQELEGSELPWSNASLGESSSSSLGLAFQSEQNFSWMSSDVSPGTASAESDFGPSQNDQTSEHVDSSLDANSEPKFQNEEVVSDFSESSSFFSTDSEQGRDFQDYAQVQSLSEDSVMDLVIPKLMHTSILFTLEERLFLCALDGKRTIAQACHHASKLPLTRALMLLKQLSQEGGVRVL